MAKAILKSLHDFEVAAEDKFEDVKIWNYISAGDDKTRAEKRAAFQKFWLQPNVLTARQSVPSSWTSVLGQPIRIPICMSPSTVQSLAAPDGDVLAAQVADELGTLMVYSSVSRMTIEDFGSRLPPGGIVWAQTYLFRDKRNTLHMVRNAERYGFKALVVTVDSPIDYGGKTNPEDIISNYITPVKGGVNISPNVIYLNDKERENRPYSDVEMWTPGRGLCGKEAFSVPTWEDVKWLKGQTKLPIVLKGILTAKAARLAVKAGVDGILVSSHGGRQLPGVPPPLFALPDVLGAVKGSNVEVYLDGEVRSGSDVFKAIALGARAVFISRPVLWGLAVNGKAGLKKVMKILEDEFTTVMTMCGCNTIQEVDPSFVKLKSVF